MPPPSTTMRRYSSWVTRVVALVIDSLVPAVVLTIGAVIGWPHYVYGVERQWCLDGSCSTQLVTEKSGLGPTWYIGVVIAVLFTLANKGYLEGHSGKSIGKRMLSCTTIADASGRPLGVGRAILRVVLLCVDFLICYVGVLWPLWDSKRRCLLSDQLTGAVVIKD